MRNPYSVLGVRTGASEAEIRAAFRARSKLLHPDLNPSAQAASDFDTLVQAYNLLSNPGRRAVFDRAQTMQTPPRHPRPKAKPSPPPQPRRTKTPPNAGSTSNPPLTEAERKRRQFIYFGVLLGLPMGIVLTLFLGIFAYVLMWDEEAEAWRGWGIVFFTAFMAIVFALAWRFWARYVGAAIPPNLPQKTLSAIRRRFKKLLFVTKEPTKG